MSTHEVLVVRVESISPHNNADRLEIIRVSGYDYQICSAKGGFKVGDLAIFVEPDYVVDTTKPPFESFHDGKRDKLRVTVRRFRGEWSEGLLIPAGENHTFGQNVMEELQITRYEPPAQKGFHWGAEGSDLKGGSCAKRPDVGHLIPEYALENYKKFSSLLSPEDDVIYTTKIHGTNARYVFWDGEMHCGSHKTWKTKPGEKKEQENSTTGEKVEWLTPESSWWNGLQDNPWIEEWCRKNPGITVFGELFGNTVQGNKFHYGCKDGKLGIRIFDVFKDGAWVSFSELLTNPLYEGLKLVPVLYQGKHDRTTLMELAEKWEDSLENCGENHIREGIVIRKVENVKDEHGRRVVLKYVSNNYLMRS